MLRILEYLHNRDEKTQKSINSLYNILENLKKNKIYNNFLDEIDSIFKIPNEISDKFIKKTLADTFDFYETHKLDKKFSKFNALTMLMKFNVYVIILFLKGLFIKEKKDKSEIIIDHIEKKDQLILYDSLINLFGTVNVICIVPNKEKFKYRKIRIYNYPIDKNYIKNFKLFINIIKCSKIIYTLSKKDNFNYLLLYFKILNSFLYYNNLFSNLKARYTINHQHYHTNVIKNYLFKKNGGVCSAVIEKNIHNLGKTGFYYDSDLYLAIGNLSYERSLEYGAKFNKTKFVGSFYMENNWFSQKKEIRNGFKKFDIVLLGLVDLWWHNTYNKYKEDYLLQFEWIKKISLEFPELNIISIYQKGRIINNDELKIFKDSNIKIIIPDNSYSGYGYGINSKLNLTFGSTIGFEMIGNGSNCFFLDYKSRNQQFLSNNKKIELLKIKSYDKLKEIVNQIFINKIDIFQKILEENNINKQDFCLQSNNVSKNIYNALIDYNKK